MLSFLLHIYIFLSLFFTKTIKQQEKRHPRHFLKNQESFLMRTTQRRYFHFVHFVFAFLLVCYLPVSYNSWVKGFFSLNDEKWDDTKNVYHFWGKIEIFSFPCFCFSSALLISSLFLCCPVRLKRSIKWECVWWQWTLISTRFVAYIYITYATNLKRLIRDLIQLN